MPTYSLLDPFEFLYYFYRIRGELIKVLSIIVCIPSTFCPTLGHHQGRICYKSDVTFVLANYYCVSRAESTRDTYNYGQYLNQFPPNTIKVIREFERIQKRICRHKMSIMFNEICINEEMLPKYTYIYIYMDVVNFGYLRSKPLISCDISITKMKARNNVKKVIFKYVKTNKDGFESQCFCCIDVLIFFSFLFRKESLLRSNCSE